MTIELQTRVSRRGFRPQNMVSRLMAVEPCLQAVLPREDTGR